MKINRQHIKTRPARLADAVASNAVVYVRGPGVFARVVRTKEPGWLRHEAKVDGFYSTFSGYCAQCHMTPIGGGKNFTVTVRRIRFTDPWDFESNEVLQATPDLVAAMSANVDTALLAAQEEARRLENQKLVLMEVLRGS